MIAGEAMFAFCWTPEEARLGLAPWVPRRAWNEASDAWAACGQLQWMGRDRLLVRMNRCTAMDRSAVTRWLEEWAAEDGWSLVHADGLVAPLAVRDGGPDLRCTYCRARARPNWISAGPLYRLWTRPRTLCPDCGLGHRLPVRPRRQVPSAAGD